MWTSPIGSRGICSGEAYVRSRAGRTRHRNSFRDRARFPRSKESTASKSSRSSSVERVRFSVDRRVPLSGRRSSTKRAARWGVNVRRLHRRISSCASTGSAGLPGSASLRLMGRRFFRTGASASRPKSISHWTVRKILPGSCAKSENFFPAKALGARSLFSLTRSGS